jgi:hypothetical protein
MKQIIIEVTNEGEVKIETRGFTGTNCLEESQFIKDILGEETARQLTPAYYQREKQKEVVKKHLPLCG